MKYLESCCSNSHVDKTSASSGVAHGLDITVDRSNDSPQKIENGEQNEMSNNFSKSVASNTRCFGDSGCKDFEHQNNEHENGN